MLVMCNQQAAELDKTNLYIYIYRERERTTTTKKKKN